nr:translocation/assembly module TamB domain-containing protein [Pseudomonas insulae]
MRKVALVALGVVLGLLLLVAGLLGSQAGSRALLGWLPGVQVEGFQGRLGGAWQAERLVWQQGEQRVEVLAPRFDWAPSCLLRLTLCLQRVVAERVQVVLPASDAPDDTPLQLPSLRLPLAIELREVQLGSLLVGDSGMSRDLSLVAHWTADGLRIERLSLRQGDLALSLSGTLRPDGDWPLQVQGTLDLPAPEQQPWRLELQVQGDLQRRLQVTADSSGYLLGKLSGELQPLAEHLPASAQLSAEAFKASSALPETLRLQNIQLNATGDLASGYQLQGNASLPGEGGAVALQLQGRVDAQGADIAALRLDAGNQQDALLDGRIDWQDGLAVDARLHWRDFPWQRLYPLDQPPPVTLRELQAEAHYRDGNYLGNFAAQLDGPAGAFSLASPVSGDLRQVHLPSLQLQAGQGRAEGSLGLRFAEGLAWDANLSLNQLDPAYWLEQLPGALAGSLRSEGEWSAGQWRGQADLDLNGRLRGQPARFQLQGSGETQRWNLANLDLRLGDNRVHGSGALDQRLRGELQLAMPRLGQLWPGLQGRLDGRLNLAGSLQAPQGQLRLQGQDLALTERRVQQLQVDGTLDAAQQGRLSLSGTGIRLGDSELGNFTATAAGDRRRQRLDLQLQGPQLASQLGFDGTLEQGAAGWNWRGRLARGEVKAGGQDWQLQQPARLQRLADGRVELGAQCWLSGAASLCGEDARLLPEPRLRFRLRGFPLASLQPWLPEDFAWDGALSGDIQLDLPSSGPNGVIRLNADGGTLRIREDGHWLSFPYSRLALDSTLRPQRVDSQLQFQGGPLGEFALQARLDPRPASKPLSGDFRLSGVDVSVARPFLPMVEHLAGRLDGSGQLSGGLLAPRVDGNLRLTGGEVSGPQLPLQVEQLQLQAQIAGERLQLRGEWRSGPQGQGSLNGQLSWAPTLEGDLQIRGERLPVTVEPYAQLEVEPNLVARLADNQLAVAGQVLVPRGAIEIRELPPSTVRVSEDARVVGREQRARQALGIAMDVDVEVGRDKLTFAGFGLNAELAGRLHIGDNLDTRGELQLNNGRYRAYGQRLTIRRARLLFTGPIDQPYLDVEAIRRVDEVVAGLRVSGSAAQPRTQVFAEPAMSEEQALSYLVLGRPLASSGEDNNVLAEAALGLGLAGSSSMTGDIAQRLGIRDFELDTSGSGQSTSVVASGKLSERLSLRYGVGVFEPANTIALRYELSRRLYLEAASGLASSLDLFYKRDF